MPKGYPKSGVNKGWFKAERFAVNCKQCETEFTLPKCFLGKRFYCSKDCYYTSRVGKKASPHSAETKRKIGLANKGNKAWNKGIPRTKAEKEKMSLARMGKGGVRGEKHYKWKEEGLSYKGVHSWASRELEKPENCQICDKATSGYSMHWANKSHLYKRDTSDWLALCALCHKAYDYCRKFIYENITLTI